MNLHDRIQLLKHILRWRFTWSRRDLNYKPAGVVSKKFISAREAARKVFDGATVFSSGMAGNARCSVFFWAIREAFQRTGRPRDLTWINVGAQGGRGKVPGTVEELALPGLLRAYLAGHLETAKALLAMADAGQIELYTLPQGVMTLLLEAQANNRTHLLSPVGVGTFLDPRVGKGAAVTPSAPEQYIEVAGDRLRYTMPKIDLALFNAPYADAEGNIYFKDASSLSENVFSLKAARANDGYVMVTVSAVIPKDEKRISLPAKAIDFIVVHPYNEQTASIPQLKYWPMFTPGADVDVHSAEEKLKFINQVLHITPVRNPVDNALARLAATIFMENTPSGAMINIGVGHPEEVARYLVEGGQAKDLIFTTEAGAYGGLPVPGIFFGAAIRPEKLISSTEMFHLYQERLDTAVLGFLQVDGEGNVNASQRGERLYDFVGPGGFPDIVDGARNIIFVGSWMAGAKYAINDGRLRLIKRGKPKFVNKVDHITFSAEQALKKGKRVFYVTHTGVFRLTDHGLLLDRIMPGIDLEKDILQATEASFRLPDGKIPEVDRFIVDGINFVLKRPYSVQKVQKEKEVATG